MVRAKLKSGVFRRWDGKEFNPGDIISDIKDVPEGFRDMWEELPPSKRRVAARKEPTKKEEPKVEVKEEPAAKEELPKKKKAPRRRAKRVAEKATKKK